MKQWGPSTDNAIWALVSEKNELGEPKYRTGQVLEIIRAGDPEWGIEPCPIPRRTFFDHLRKLRAQRVDPACKGFSPEEVSNRLRAVDDPSHRVDYHAAPAIQVLHRNKSLELFRDQP